MRTFIKEYFHVPEDGKVNEKVLYTRIGAAIMAMLICLGAMSYTAYAYFTSGNVTSVKNTVSASNFNVTVKAFDKVAAADVAVNPEPGKTNLQKVTLQKDVAYIITIEKHHKSNAKTGFCVITPEGTDMVYHTQQIGVDGDKETEKLEFTFRSNETVTLDIVAHWGTSSYYDGYKNKGENHELYILDNETVELKLSAPPAGGVSTEPEENVAPETTGPQEKPVVPEDTESSANAETTAPVTEEGKPTPETTEKAEETVAPETEAETTTEETMAEPEGSAETEVANGADTAETVAAPVAP